MFTVEDNTLILEINLAIKTYKLPCDASEYANMKLFLNRLNHRASKVPITHEMVEIKGEHIYINAEKPFNQRLPYIKQPQILVDRECHDMAKLGAKKANMKIHEYVKLCIVSCKSQSSGKMYDE